MARSEDVSGRRGRQCSAVAAAAGESGSLALIWWSAGGVVGERERGKEAGPPLFTLELAIPPSDAQPCRPPAGRVSWPATAPACRSGGPFKPKPPFIRTGCWGREVEWVLRPPLSPHCVQKNGGGEGKVSRRSLTVFGRLGMVSGSLEELKVASCLKGSVPRTMRRKRSFGAPPWLLLFLLLSSLCFPSPFSPCL